KKIHEENEAKLHGMSQSEILEEQRRLLSQLGTLNLSLTSCCFFSCVSVFYCDLTAIQLLVHSSNVAPAPPITGKREIDELPVKPEKGWLHMDKLEPEKLEWMRDLPASRKRSTKKAMQARFNFDGVLISPTEDLPTHLGLHHHGDEPELAGYSLQELFLLSRSQVTQQRCLALTTLGHILTKARASDFASSVRGSVFATLLDAGLLFLLRFSLDDKYEGLMAAAVQALRALLVTVDDEECLDNTFSWFLGMATFPLLPFAQEEDKEDDEGLEDALKETAKEKEEKKSDHDVARNDVIKGLLRMKLLPRLRYILEVLRPPPRTVLDILEILIRIARHSPTSAIQVLDCPRLMNTVMSEFLPCSWSPPVSPTPDRLHGFPVAAAMKLVRILATAGRHTCARLLNSLGARERISCFVAQEPQDLLLEPGEALRISTEALRLWAVAAGYGQACDLYRDLYPILVQTLQSHPMRWPPGHVLRPLELQRVQALHTLLTNVTHTAGCHQELQASLTRWASFTPVRSVSDIMTCLNGWMCLYCPYRSCSALCNPLSCSDPEMVPSLPSLTWSGGKPALSLSGSNSPFPFLIALCYLLEVLSSIHKGIAHKVRFCTKTVFRCLTLDMPTQNQEKQISLYHRVAATMVPWLLPGSEYLARDLLSTVIFNLDLITEGRCGGPEAADLSELQLQEGGSFGHFPVGPLMRDACAQLPSIRGCYLTHLASLEPTILYSRDRHLMRTPWVRSWMLPEVQGPILPSDWPFLPIISLYERVGIPGGGDMQVEALPQASVKSVVHSLQWLLILERWRDGVLQAVTPAAKLARLSCLFLCSSDLFLERPVQQLTWALLRSLCVPARLAALDLGVPLPGLASFHDLYASLLSQFEAVSFGDHLFCCFVLLPLQQRFSVSLRLALFGEHVGLLRSLGLPLQQLPVPLEQFTYPPEDSLTLLRLYFQVLVTGALRCAWCPVLYVVALAHLNAFIFSQDVVSQEVDAARRSMLRKTYYLTDEVLKDHLLLFKVPHLQKELGFDAYEHLPPIRARRLESVVGMEEGESLKT
uniref:RNA polymerase II associated protein 1 n=1 Tax=Scleropages formosus TaxID=113540 RepID=A0A8C9VXR7_SCLFO